MTINSLVTQNAIFIEYFAKVHIKRKVFCQFKGFALSEIPWGLKISEQQPKQPKDEKIFKWWIMSTKPLTKCMYKKMYKNKNLLNRISSSTFCSNAQLSSDIIY